MIYCATQPEVIDRPTTADPKFKDFLNTLKEPVPIENEPPMWACILHNDNTTLPGFVVSVLQNAFGVTAGASRIMMTAHETGSCVVIVTTKDRVETMLRDATAMVQRAEFRKDHMNPNGGCELRFSTREETSNQKRTGS